MGGAWAYFVRGLPLLPSQRCGAGRRGPCGCTPGIRWILQPSREVVSFLVALGKGMGAGFSCCSGGLMMVVVLCSCSKVGLMRSSATDGISLCSY
ncbi:hypothetical protein COCSUDRAFT_33280 [Coccomyxa subellipsoidea C-169]|uniref:Uncharacterized protein n=1 Tax=Coccomyxa subellipsoidea (strain C-169) TaxID=574566 RepID=I0YXS9_COCSC|nr:hypothetical protein COCSUDRAFT_33280 [Coccomyxa subellipsoidea C-169]EIE23198.1 hypothetical protein COCSUDRAFT_33280 [Coccomyxa subellipsoidea C-169]|eukprot:XP_005647742.1 hypothetical protein COCSUDRAFT_33280 [Coccomyxa subellipsoidea C-169]